MSRELHRRIAETDVLLRRHLKRVRALTADLDGQYAKVGPGKAGKILRKRNRLNEAAATHRFGGIV